jgi:hypothetical protein
MNGDLTPEELLRRIGEIRLMERCRVTAQKYVKADGEASVYYAIQPWDNQAQKTKSIRVRKDQREALESAYKAHQHFRKLVRQYEDQIIWRTRAELGISRR